MKKANGQEVFSDRLETWLKGTQPKTINSLGQAFGKKSFAAVVLLLMIIPALPLPTGGVTHIFEIVAMLLALEHIVGFDKVWLPNRLKGVKVASAANNRAIPMILRRIRWFEKRSSPRLETVFHTTLTSRLIWIIVFIFTLVAFLAPPFSGLDTLPSLGVVLICLSIILDDSFILLFGLLAGTLGTIIVIGLGAAAVNLLRRLF